MTTDQTFYERLTRGWVNKATETETVKMALDLSVHGDGSQRHTAKAWLADHPSAVRDIEKSDPTFIAKRREEAIEKGDEPVDSPYEALDRGLRKFCKANAIEKPWTVGLAKFVATPEGAALKRAYDEDPSPPQRHTKHEAPPTASAFDALTEGLTKFCAANKIEKVWTDGLEKFRATPEGAELNAAVYGEEG